MDFEKIETDHFPKYCRTCLKQCEGTKHIVSDLETSIFQLLKQCAYYDSKKLYPDGICQECYEKLESFREFQAICKKTKKIFDKFTKLKVVKTSDNDKDKNNTDPLQNEGEPIIVKVEIEDLVELPQSTKEEIVLSNNTSAIENENVEGIIEKTISNTHKCEVCKKFYSSSNVLKRHMLRHTKKRAFKCGACGHGFNAKFQLIRHMEVHTFTQITCKFNCGQTFDRTHKAEKHYRKEHADDIKEERPSVFVCEVCGNSFTTLRSLNDHHYTHLPAEQHPYRCNQCGKRFTQASNLNVHILRHNGTKKFECSYCGSKKTTARELRLHISNIHTKDRQARCDKCSKIFLNPGCLSRHVKAVHLGQKKFECRYCDEAFATGETLKYHERRHTGEKPHQCTICGHRFIQPCALKKHINTHKNQYGMIA